MRIRYHLILSVVFALSLVAGGASAQNLIVNPGFETGDLSGWLVFGLNPSSTASVGSPDNGPSAPGTNHAFLDNQAEALALVLKQSTPDGSVTEGTASYSVDLNVIEAGPGAVVFVQVFAEQAGGGVIGGSGLQGPYFPSGGWIVVSGSFAAPANTAFLTIQIEATTGAVTGSVSKLRVDNVSLEGELATPTKSTSWSGIKTLFN